MKKLVIGIFIMALVVSFAFAGGGGQNAGKTTLTLYSWYGGAERTMAEALVTDFLAANPNIRVEQNHGGTEYLSKINTLIASGTTPDVFQVDEAMVNEWGEKGVGADLYPYYTQKGVKPEDFYVDKYLFKTGGHLWGVGANPTTMVLYYNKALFKQAGVAEPPASAVNPWTWDQYVAAAKKLTKDSNGRTPNDAGFNYDSVIQWGTVMPTNNRNLLMPLFYNAGISVVNDSGTAFALNSPQGIRVVQAVANLAAVDKVAPTYATTISNSFSNQSAMLMNGQLAMYIGGGWETANYLNENFDFGIAQLPTFGSTGANHTWAAGFMLKKGGSQEAFQLFDFMMDFNNWVSAATKHNIGLTGGIPTTQNTFSNPTLNAAWSKINNPTVGRVFTDIIQNNCRIGENITVKNWSEIMNNTIAPGLDKVWMGEETADRALRTINGQLGGKFQGVWR